MNKRDWQAMVMLKREGAQKSLKTAEQHLHASFDQQQPSSIEITAWSRFTPGRHS